MPAQQVVLVTGASSGFGRLTAESLARAGHIVVARMRDVAGRNASNMAALDELATRERIAISAVDLDVQSQQSADDAIATVLAEHGHIDAVVQNAGHMMLVQRKRSPRSSWPPSTTSTSSEPSG